MSGENIVTATEDSKYLQYPTGIAVYGNSLYWTDMYKKHVATCELQENFTCKNTRVVSTSFTLPLELAVFGPASN